MAIQNSSVSDLLMYAAYFSTGVPIFSHWFEFLYTLDLNFLMILDITNKFFSDFRLYKFCLSFSTVFHLYNFVYTILSGTLSIDLTGFLLSGAFQKGLLNPRLAEIFPYIFTY